MRNTLIIIGLIFAIFCWKASHLGYALYAQKQERQTEGTRLAKSYTAITTVDEVFVYNGKDSYVVVEGKTGQNVPMIAWFKDKQLVSFEYRQDIKSEETVTADLKRRAVGATKMQVTPGMENSKPLWEVRFVDQEGKLNYYYYNMKSGDFIRSVRLQKVGS